MKIGRDVLLCCRTCFCIWLKHSVGSAGSGPSCPACACSAGLSCVQGTPLAATPVGRASASPMPLLVVSLSLQLDVALMLCFAVRSVEADMMHQGAWLESISECDVQQHTNCDMNRDKL